MEQRRRPFLEQVELVLRTYCFAVIWVQLVDRLLRWLLTDAYARAGSVELTAMPPLSVLMHYLPQHEWGRELLALGPNFSAFMSLVFAPLVEEALFRMLPLMVMLAIMQKWGKEDSALRKAFRDMVLIVFCGIIFGIAHGHPLNVFIQGAVGLFLGILYLKNAPQQRFAAYFTCVSVHSLYNLTVLVW